MDKARRWLEQNLHYRFENEDLLEQALTHRSAQGDNNERLEFLGDAVLDVVISEALYRSHPESDEGDLSRLRASLVRAATLAAIARDLGVGEHLRLGSGERKTGGHQRESIVANAFEAILGAVYLDGGFDTAKDLIEKLYAERLANLPDAEELRDPKTRLQEWLQARRHSLPDYELLEVSGKAHRQQFRVRCSVPELDVDAAGDGSSRRAAEQQAAREVLQLVKTRASK